jgi:hypothetical protein
VLLDLTRANRSDRLRLGRELLARAGELASAVRAGGRTAEAGAAAEQTRPARGRKTAAQRAVGPAPDATAEATAEAAPTDADAGGPVARVPAAERRAAALTLLAIWRDVTRDLALVALGERADVRQLDLLDDLEAAALGLPQSFAPAQLRRLDVAGERLEGNVSPELVVDALALGWAA